MASGDSSSTTLFADDDEETLTLLLLAGSTATTSNAAPSSSRLQALTQRFLEDHVGNAKLFDAIVKDVPGFAPASLSYQHRAAAPTTANAAAASQEQIPASLRSSEAGKLHLKAVQSALHVSETAALQLTLGVLLKSSSLTGESSFSDTATATTSIQWAQLLGTRSLLVQTCEYYFQQRVARLSAIAELLRNEQSYTALLDSLDAVTSLTTTASSNSAENKRGLFRLLLTAACQEDAEVQRQDFLAAQKLTTTTNGGAAAGAGTGRMSETEREDLAWRQLIHTIMERKRTIQQRERLEALEALLVLLYNRVEVRRSDLAVTVTAFQRLQFYCKTTPASDSANRFSCLAGLICVESMALWRIFDDGGGSTEDDDTENRPDGSNRRSDWKKTHPLLLGLLEEPVAGQELQALESLFRSSICNVDDRSSAKQNARPTGLPEAPESLALLAFGLLLNAAGSTTSDSNMETDDNINSDDAEVSKKLYSTGLELAKLANNDDYDAFGYLFNVMGFMVVPSTPTVHPSLREFLPYDLIAFHGEDETENPIYLVDSPYTEDDDDDDTMELSASSLAYASIGRELLTASIYAFRDVILPTHKMPLPENLGRLSSLVAVIFRNSPILCSRFWSDWEGYALDREDPSPLCLLLKATHRLATDALQAGRKIDENVLQEITPLLELTASFVYDARILEEVFAAILPADLIRRAISILNARSGSVQSEAFHHCRKTIIGSIGTMAKIGKTDKSRMILRGAVEEPGTENTQGPRLLASIVAKSRSAIEIAPVFGLLAALVKGAPFAWIFDSVRALNLVQDDSDVWRGLFEQNDSTQATVQFVSVLVGRLHTLVFSPLLEERVVVELLSVVKSAVFSASELLPAFLSTMSPTTQQSRRTRLAYSSAAMIMDMICNLLQQLRFVGEMHKLGRVCAAAFEFLDGVIAALAASAGLGEAVCFFATAPVALSLSESLEATLQDASVLQAAMTEDKNEGSMFTSFRRSDYSNTEDHVHRVSSLLVKRLADFDSVSFDVENARSLGWLDGNDDSEEALLQASFSALRLLNWWAKSIEVKLPPEFQGMPKSESSASAGYDSTDYFGASPARLLVAPSIPPPQIRGNALLSSAWSKAGVSTFDLLLAFFGVSNKSVIEGFLAGEALDVLSFCLFHGQIAASTGNGLTGSPLFRGIAQSASFRKILLGQMESTLSTLGKRALSSTEKMDVIVNLRYLRLLVGVIDQGPSVAAKILAAENGSMVNSLVEAVSRALSEVSSKNDVASLLADATLIDHMRIAVGCLSVLRSIWQFVRTPSSNDETDVGRGALSRIVDADTVLVQDLTGFVFDWAKKLPTENDLGLGQRTSFKRGRCVLRSLISVALDLLTVEISWVQNRASFSGDALVVRKIEDALNGKLDRIVDSTKAFTAVGDFVPVALAVKSFATSPNVAFARLRDPSDLSESLLTLSGPSSHGNHAFFSHINGHDTLFADRWFSSLSDDTTASGTTFSELDVEYSLLVNELRCGQSWKACAQMLSQLMEQWRRDAPEHPLFTVSPSSFSRSMALEILRGFRKNLDQFELGRLEIPGSIFKNECLLVAKLSSSLLLTFVSIGDASEKAPKYEWIETMSLVSEVAKKLSVAFTPESTDALVMMQHLLASASMISTVSLGKDFSELYDFTEKSRVEDFYADLTDSACKAISTVGRMSVSRDAAQSCLYTCVSFLTAIIEKTIAVSESSWRMDYHFSERICQVFIEHDTVRTLVSQAGRQWPTSAATPANLPTGKTDSQTVVLAVLNLFTKIATTGDASMLALLVRSDFALTLFSLSRHPEMTLQADVDPKLRGYRHRAFPSEPIGYDDPAHKVWRASMEFLGACLRSSRRKSTVETEMMKIFRKVAINFLNENRHTVASCLKGCSSVEFGHAAAKQHAFTLNLLREAKLILSIVSELCGKTARDRFEHQCPGLTKALIGESAAVAVSLCTFLGASGTSRDIFHALDEADASDAMTVDQGPLLAALGPVYRLLAGGLQNAKHEAIRYSSHFVLNNSRAVTREDREAQQIFCDDRFKPSNNERPGTMSSLEQTCRSGVASNFSFQLELEAAECLFFATDVLWKTHPASSSFVEYSAEEARQIDSMRFVKPGMLIAFRSESPGSLFLPSNTAFGGVSESIKFARVVRSDTVHRKWYATLVTPKGRGEECVVSESQLAGIEDVAKRICMFSYVAAPETSSDLEALGRNISLGHLILALRWCGEISSEKNDYEKSPAIARLAELTTALLGMEMSVQLEARTKQHPGEIESDLKVFADQLFDLYGEASEFGPISPGFSLGGQREGRLKNVLSQESWDGARSQLHKFLEVAVAALTQQRNEKMRTIERGSLLRRRSSSGSPFRGLGT